jgi:hypothetical protein
MSAYAPPQVPQPFGQDPMQPASAGKGWAIGALVCGILGICVPGLAIVGVILGVVALTKMQSKGLAWAGLIVSIVAVVLNIFVVLIGILLPALGKARQSAQQIKSSTQVRGIVQACTIYAQNDPNGEMPPAAGWEDALIGQGLFSRELLIAPGADETLGTSYIYVPGWNDKKLADAGISPSQQVLVYEDMDKFPRQRGINIGFYDGTVNFMPFDEGVAFLQTARDGFGNPVAVPRKR